jgi:beta-lactamase regulating signal transducer with metallopeptidase domain
MIPHAASLSSPFFAHLIEPALRSLALGGLAALALFAFRVKNPSARLTVWTAVLYAALAMPLLAIAVPSLSVPMPSILAPIFSKAAPAKTSPRPTTMLSGPVYAATVDPTPTPTISFSQTSAEHRTQAPRRSTLRHRSIGASTLPNVLAANIGQPISSSPEKQKPGIDAAQTTQASVSERLPIHFSWTIFATAIFLAVALLMLARIALGAIFGHRLICSSETIGDLEPIRVLIRQASAAGVASAPRLAESDLVSVPVTLGIFRPLILLPTYWRTWDDRTLGAVIAHEMAHVARRDALTQRLALIHRAVFWFSPLAWWLSRALANAAEEASDEAALTVVQDRAFYAETVIEFFAALSENPRRVYWQGVSMAAPGQAERRVDHILNWKGAVSMRIRKSLAFGLAILGVPAVLLTAAARPSASQSSAPVILPAPAAPPLPAMPDAAPLPRAEAVPAPLRPQAPPEPLTVLAQSVPPAPEAPPSSAVLASPDGDSAIWVQPHVSVDVDSVQAEIAMQKEIQDAVNNSAVYSMQFKTLDDIDKRMTFTMDSKSPEVAAKLDQLKNQLDRLRAESPQDKEAVANAQQEIAALKDELKLQVKQVMPSSDFRYQIGPVQKFSLGDMGDRFVIVSGDSPIIMSGNSQDVEHATGLRGNIKGDFIWFQHDEKSYIIRDQGLVNQAKSYFKPEQDLGEKQSALGKQQSALGDQQRQLGDKMRDVHVTVPDMSADMQKLQDQLKQLSTSGGTQQQIGEAQRQLGEMMRKLGQNQSTAGDQQRQIGEQMRTLGDQQRQLGDQQRDLGRQQRDAGDQARIQMKQLLDDAVSKGTAQPE